MSITKKGFNLRLKPSRGKTFKCSDDCNTNVKVENKISNKKAPRTKPQQPSVAENNAE